MSRRDPPGWRDDRSRSDTYRPGRSPSRDRWRPGDGRQHDNQGYDSYRGSGYRGADSSSSRGSYSRGGYDLYGPPPAADVYRPAVPQGDFSFRAPPPPGSEPIRFTAINVAREGGSAGRRPDRRDGRRGGPARRGGRLHWKPPHPSERALVSGAAVSGPGQRVNDPNAAAKFRDLDDLSDDDEVDMEISEQESPSDAEQPRKRARTDDGGGAGDAGPKWSNPDPYTALPCPDESTRKKRDVVKLIRKARVEETQPVATAAPLAEDFIAIGASSDEDEDRDDEAEHGANGASLDLKLPARPPTGPRADRLGAGEARAVGAAATMLGGNYAAPSYDGSGSLGSRKRTADDVIKPPDYGQLKKANMRPSKGMIVPNWRPKANEESCPWAVSDHSDQANVYTRLHKEIKDFYNFVRPREYEQRIRNRLVENLRRAMRRDARNFGSAEVHPFGSFVSGLYLPTADMDIVVCSASFMRGGPATYLSAKSWLYKFQKFLLAQGIAEAELIEVIAHARIPLVKYVDAATGLRVDVSFENMGGVRAVDTFVRWKDEYPAMPVLVTLIKHFLLMRGLNEPVNGGIGGFSVICLVVSMLQLHPGAQSYAAARSENHLGELLLDFLDLYGRQFEHEKTAISLTNPIGYINKNKVRTLTYRNRDRLSIIDPNNPSNDISGGSSNTPSILARFHDAFNLLSDRIEDMSRKPHGTKGSILEVILKGDYSSFRMQREYLQHIHEETIGPCSD